MIRRTEIMIETHRRLVVRQSQASFRAWCEDCLAEVSLITPNEASALAGVNSRTIYQWIEAGRVHFTEHSGELLVCAGSLPPGQAKGPSESDQAIIGLQRAVDSECDSH